MGARTPGQLHSLFQEAFNAADMDALVKLYEPNAVLYIDRKPVVGHDAIGLMFRVLTQARPQMVLETREVIESEAGLAVLHAAWSLSSGTKGMSTEVARRQADGRWLYAIDSPYTPR
jgi:ketosteroid isomerase-like protein